MVTGRAACAFHGTRASSVLRGARARAALREQGPRLREVATRVWDEIIDDMDAEVVKRQRQQAARAAAAQSRSPSDPVRAIFAPAVSPAAAAPAPAAKQRAPAVPVHYWRTDADAAPLEAAPEGADARRLVSAEYRCPECGAHDPEYERIRVQAASAKADTWGASDRAEIITRLACRACGHAWTREEG